MTQFLLAEFAKPPGSQGMTWQPVVDAPYLVEAARANFQEIENVWVGRPHAGEIDTLVDEASVAMGNNQPYEESELASVLTQVTEQAEALALFWASYPNDLPLAETVPELHRVVETDIRESPSLEVYVRWRRA